MHIAVHEQTVDTKMVKILLDLDGQYNDHGQERIECLHRTEVIRVHLTVQRTETKENKMDSHIFKKSFMKPTFRHTHFSRETIIYCLPTPSSWNLKYFSDSLLYTSARLLI